MLTERLEERRLFTLGQDGEPVGPAFKYNDPPAGWHVDVEEHTFAGRRSGATLTLTGPDTPDVVRVARNPTLQAGVDLEINGRKMTINFAQADAPMFSTSWEINAGGGDDRVDVLLGMGDNFAALDVLRGGDGNDVLVNGDLPGYFYGGNGNDILIGGRGADRLQGDDGIDQLFGRAGEDLLVPGTGGPPVAPGATMVEPGEIVDGGAGFDRAYTTFSFVYDPAKLIFPGPVATELPDLDPSPPLPVEVSPAPHDPRLPFTQPPEGMNVSYELQGDDTSRLLVTGTSGDDVVRLTHNPANPEAMDIELNGAVMTVTFEPRGAGRRRDIEITTGAGNDVMTVDLEAGSFPNSGLDIHLGAGDDEVSQIGSGGLKASGDLGNDILRGGPAGNYLVGGEGVDELYGSSGNDTLHAGNLESRFPAIGESGYAPTEPGEVYDPGTGRDLVITAEGESAYLDGEPATREPLDVNRMFSSFQGRPTVRRGRNYTFSVTYATVGDRIRRETAGDDDMMVSGPGGFNAAAKLLRARVKHNGSILVARYRVAAPGGTFDAGDNGSYSVSPGAGAVTNTAGRTAAALPSAFGAEAAVNDAGVIGTFTVEARARRGAAQAPPPAAASARPGEQPSARQSGRGRQESALADLLA